MIQCTLLINEAKHVVCDHVLYLQVVFNANWQKISEQLKILRRMNWTETCTINLEKWSDVWTL